MKSIFIKYFDKFSSKTLREMQHTIMKRYKQDITFFKRVNSAVNM